jgi:hypothetical protein
MMKLLEFGEEVAHLLLQMTLLKMPLNLPQMMLPN